MSLFDLVIYHSECFDGLASAWVYRKYFDSKYVLKETLYLPLTYGKPLVIPPGRADREVLIVDCCPSPDIIETLKSTSKRVVVLDHHETNQTLISKLQGIESVFDMSRSGCQITWDYFFPGEPRPKIINYIGDRDLWTHKLPHTHEINKYIYSLPITFDTLDTLHVGWNTIHGESFYISTGKVLKEQYDEQVKKLAGGFVPASFTDKEGRAYPISIGDCPWMFRSDVGSFLYEKYPKVEFVLLYTYYANTKKFAVSFRGRGGCPNLALLAKQYGGGGHHCASGCSLENLNNVVF